MPITPILSLLLTQLAATAPPSLAQDRMALCQQEARQDPAAAILTASIWVNEGTSSERSLPLQCLGMAYTSLLRWQAAEEAFLSARDATAATSPSGRARLAAMAGEAALVDKRMDAALAAFDLATADLVQTVNPALNGEIAADRARALVSLGRTAEAAGALETARRDAPQLPSAWLLSATLARRTGDLTAAQGFIETAAALAPSDPSIGLEAGVIAVLAGRDAAAHASWQSVVTTAPDTAEAEQAKAYLKQLEEPASR